MTEHNDEIEYTPGNTTRHYQSLRVGLSPYFRGDDYETHLECVARILYDLFAWIKNTGGAEGDFLRAYRMALQMSVDWHTEQLEELENIERELLEAQE